MRLLKTIKSIIVKIIYFLAILLAVRNPHDIVIYAVIVSLTNFLNNIISFIYAKHRISFDFSKIQIKKYIKPLIAVLVITNADLLYSQLDRVMLGRYVSGVSVTVYYTAYYLISTLSAIPYSIINVSIPRLSYLLKNEGKEIYEEKLNNSISSLIFIIVPMCLGVFVLSKEAIILYAGKKYLMAIVPLMIACITRIFISLESVMNNLVMYPNNREDRILKVSLTCGISNLIINYLLVLFKIFSPLTALATTGLVELTIFIIHYTYARKKMNIDVRVFSKKNMTYILLSLLFIPISLIIRSLKLNFYINIIVIVIICSLMYFIVLYIKKDNNLLFILDKFKGKLKVGRK